VVETTLAVGGQRGGGLEGGGVWGGLLTVNDSTDSLCLALGDAGAELLCLSVL